MPQYDVVVLGGGPGGYVAAIRAAQLGKTAAVVEQEKLGGTCLHRGCIPSKALLRSAEVYHTIRHGLSFGIETEGSRLRFELVQTRKQAIVEQLHKGIQFLMKKNRVDVYHGCGEIVSTPGGEGGQGVIAVTDASGKAKQVIFGDLIIATGSRPRSLPGLSIDGTLVMTTEEALKMEALPASMIILGGGVIGVEWASMMNDFGVEVTIVEYADRLLPLEDAEISKELQRLFAKRGIKVYAGAKLLPQTLEIGPHGVRMQAERANGTQELSAERMLVAVGRQANVEGFGLERTQIRIERGVIAVNASMRTDEPHVYAVGDCIGGLQLAHAASHEGIVAAESIAGRSHEPLDDMRIPRCIYGRPEIASVGLTEQQAVERGHEVKTGKFSFKGIGKSLIHGSSDGFVKVVADARDDALLGVHMIGPHVTDYIGEAELAQLLGATTMQLGRMIHPHPTLSEIIGEATLAVHGAAIHM